MLKLLHRKPLFLMACRVPNYLPRPSPFIALPNFSTIKISNPIPPLSSSDSEDSTQLFDSKHVYVSKHYKQIDNDSILQLLDKFKLEYKKYASGQTVIKYCPFCPKPHNFQRDNQFTLNLKANSGAFFCFRCGIKGSFLDFKNMLYNGTQNHQLFDYSKLVSPIGMVNQDSPGTGPEPKLANESLAFLHTKGLEGPEFEKITKYLTDTGPESRHLKVEILNKYKVGVGIETFANEDGHFIDVPVVYFPMFIPRSKKSKQKLLTQQVKFDENSISTIDFQLVRNKIRGAGKENKIYQRMEPTPGQWGMFGLNTVDPNNKEIVITEGEFDAMAVNQATRYQAISLPNGANHLPVQVLPFLERFSKIYLWMDADEVGQANARKFAEKLGINRTFIVNSRCLDINGPKDANDALREDPKSLENYILMAKALSQENITTFSEMKAAVYNKILKFEESQGLKSTSLPWFNKKLKGFRRGEFTIYSGLTGSGKTTLLSQLSIDFVKQGVSTLWGSFEIKNEILMTHMMLQFSEANLVKEPQSFEFYANRFENLPLYFMKFFGSSQLDQIISTIEFAIYTYDISHIVIDNLQFLLSGQGRGFEKFDLQDEAVSRFRKLATSKNVHISLVIHPRKVDDTQEINMSSIFGTAKSTQEADNVFLIQNHKGYKVLELKKNRFDGEVGSIALGFDKDTKRYFELYQHEVVDLENEKVKISDIIQRVRKQERKEKGKDSEKEDHQQAVSLEKKAKKEEAKKPEKHFKTKYERRLVAVENPPNSSETLKTEKNQSKEPENIKIDLEKSEKIMEKNSETLLNEEIQNKNTNDTIKVEEIIRKSIVTPSLDERKGDNSTLTARKEEIEAEKIIKEASSFFTGETKKEEKINLIDENGHNKSILEERKKNILKYSPIEEPDTKTFFDEDYKVPKMDEIDDIINKTIKNYAKKK